MGIEYIVFRGRLIGLIVDYLAVISGIGDKEELKRVIQTFRQDLLFVHASLDDGKDFPADVPDPTIKRLIDGEST